MEVCEEAVEEARRVPPRPWRASLQPFPTP
jgi:hypothetical protein